MKFISTLLIAAGFFSTQAHAGWVTFSGKVADIRRETDGITCTWAKYQLMVKISDGTTAKWLRLSVADEAYKDMLAMMMLALSADNTVNVIYDDNSDGCVGGWNSIQSNGILKSVSLLR